MRWLAVLGMWLCEFLEPVWRPLCLMIAFVVRFLGCAMLTLALHVAVTSSFGKQLLDVKALTFLYNKCYYVQTGAAYSTHHTKHIKYRWQRQRVPLVFAYCVQTSAG